MAHFQNGPCQTAHFTGKAHFRNIVSTEQSTLMWKHVYVISVPDVIRIVVI